MLFHRVGAQPKVTYRVSFSNSFCAYEEIVAVSQQTHQQLCPCILILQNLDVFGLVPLGVFVVPGVLSDLLLCDGFRFSARSS